MADGLEATDVEADADGKPEPKEERIENGKGWGSVDCSQLSNMRANLLAALRFLGW